MKELQFFSKEYIERCKELSPIQRLQFLEDLRTLYFKSRPEKRWLISIKILENL